MSKKIFIVFGHHDTKTSFNAAIRDTFVSEAENLGHEVDIVNLFDEKEQLPFYDSRVNPPPQLVIDYRKRLEQADVMFLIGSCNNLRLNVILENWVDWVLHPKWFFSYRSMFPDSRFFKKYGCSVPGAMKGKQAIISLTYGEPIMSCYNFALFGDMTLRRVKKLAFNLGGMSTRYISFYSVLPNMPEAVFNKHIKKVIDLARSL